jgi:hypothetical protein
MFWKVALRDKLRGDAVIWNTGTAIKLCLKAQAVVNNAEYFGAMHMTEQIISFL